MEKPDRSKFLIQDAYDKAYDRWVENQQGAMPTTLVPNQIIPMNAILNDEQVDNLSCILDAYESGIGHGLKGDGHKDGPYSLRTCKIAYGVGYDEGMERAALAKQVPEAAPAMTVDPVAVAWGIALHGAPAGLHMHKQEAEAEFSRRNEKYPEATRELWPLGRIVPAATVAAPTDEEIANIAAHIHPDDYMEMNGSDSVDYLRYDGAVVRAFLAAAPAVQQGGEA